jgi:two-component system chemotaxis response regulator CheB
MRPVLVADAQAGRRMQLLRGDARQRVIQAVSLAQVYPLAEETMPCAMVMSADFLQDPDFEGVVRLAKLIGATLLLYSPAGAPVISSPLLRGLICVPLHPDDSLTRLLERLADPGSHIRPTSGTVGLPDLILIGASTGGVKAIETVLASFPSDCPPTLVVQHIRDGFVQGFVQRLHGRYGPRVVTAEHGDVLSRGTVYVAADANRHLTVAGHGTLRCRLVDAPPRHGHRPAVDPLFESAVERGSGVAAALLTGMGTDGAAGLGALRRAGALTIAQDRASSIVWGMPRAATEAGAALRVLPLDRIGPALLAGHAAPASAGAMGALR